ncbi:MAG: hypothetical protein K2X68_08895 [Novosphingobium sp.]|nr:hypothetical protein [Novosphingobium sp.]
MMGKPDALERLVQILIALVALMALGNGLFMLGDPYGWYRFIPTVRFTGPPNPHFIRDIGLAYLLTAVMLGYGARYPQGRWFSLFAGNLWLSAHGGFHIYEVATGICSPTIFWQDMPAVVAPPAMVWIALLILIARQRIAPAGLPRAAVLGALDRLAPGESAYLHEIARAGGHGFEKFLHFMPLTIHRHAAPADLFHMARIGATLVEDCGACALTTARAALADGVPRDLVNAALAARVPPGNLETAFAFGQALATQGADAFALGDEIEAKHGRAVRLELALTAASVRTYPAIKRGLGLSQSCAATRLEV